MIRPTNNEAGRRGRGVTFRTEPSVLSEKSSTYFGGARRRCLRCSLVEYTRYAPSSRLAIDDDRSPN